MLLFARQLLDSTFPSGYRGVQNQPPASLPRMPPMRHLCVIAMLLIVVSLAPAAPLPVVEKVELQPLAAQAERVTSALELLGTPLSDDERKELKAAKDVTAVQAVLDKRCLAGIEIGDNAAKVLTGPAKPELAEQGWRVFLIKVLN